MQCIVAWWEFQFAINMYCVKKYKQIGHLVITRKKINGGAFLLLQLYNKDQELTIRASAVRLKPGQLYFSPDCITYWMKTSLWAVELLKLTSHGFVLHPPPPALFEVTQGSLCIPWIPIITRPVSTLLLLTTCHSFTTIFHLCFLFLKQGTPVSCSWAGAMSALSGHQVLMAGWSVFC